MADPVEDETFEIDGIPLSNFAYPSWFEGFRRPRSDRFDELGSCKKPFEIRPGGYMSILKNGQWTQIFGSKRAEARHAREDRRDRRPTRRGRRLEVSAITKAASPALAQRERRRA